MIKSHHFWDSIPDASTIEDDLLTPCNQQVFMSASMAFLQRKLQDKIEECAENTSRCDSERNYSNLLIFEVINGVRSQRLYVRVKNEDKYEEIFKKESTMSPNEKLSLKQLLPKPKKPKTQGKSLVGFFKRNCSTVSLIRAPSLKKSSSLLTIFKKTTPLPSQTDLSCLSSSIQLENIYESFRLPSTHSLESVVSAGFIKPPRQDSCKFIQSYQPPSSCRSTQKTILRPEELEILRMIPSSPSKPKASSKSGRDTQCNSMNSLSSTCRSRVKERSSKLSVCMEDDDEEGESDSDMAFSVSHYGSCNLTDEIKSNFSTEGLDIIMRRLMQYFEYNSGCRLPSR